ncbi:MAG: ABC transporter permease [Candidatus Omnitrophica bacterium]|nr:ABC transporter permease [Candidatus Omnitrophota bacterium]
MNFVRVWALAKKEFVHIVRDPRSLGMAIAIPMLLLILFGFALTLDVDQVPLMIWNQDKSPVSRDFLSYFEHSSYFKIMGFASRYSELEDALERNKVLLALVLPSDFSKRIASSETADIQLLADGSDSNTATIAIGYVEAVVARYNKKNITDLLSKSSEENRTPVEMRSRVWFNADMKSRNYIIPGLIAVIMMVIASLLTSLTVAREWERGTMEQLIATPVKSHELILGKFLPYFAVGFLDVLTAVGMGEFLFHVPLRGNVGLLFLLSGVFLAGALSLGMLISIVTKNQLVASQLALVFTFLPAFLLSGFMYAISNMPHVIQMLTFFIPARYFVAILKGIYLKGIGLEALFYEVLFLTLFSVVVFILANRMFKKRIA